MIKTEGSPENRPKARDVQGFLPKIDQLDPEGLREFAAKNAIDAYNAAGLKSAVERLEAARKGR